MIVRTQAFRYTFDAPPVPPNLVALGGANWTVDEPTGVIYPNNSAGRLSEQVTSRDQEVEALVKAGPSGLHIIAGVCLLDGAATGAHVSWELLQPDNTVALFIATGVNVGREVKLPTPSAVVEGQVYRLRCRHVAGTLTSYLDDVQVGSPVALTSAEQSALTGQRVGLINFAGFTNTTELTGWTLTDEPDPDTTAPAAPTGVTATASGADVSVAWAAAPDSEGVTGYRVAVDGGAWQAVAASPWTHVDGAGADHTYTVQAGDAAGNYSSSATATYDYEAPPLAGQAAAEVALLRRLMGDTVTPQRYTDAELTAALDAAPSCPVPLEGGLPAPGVVASRDTYGVAAALWEDRALLEQAAGVREPDRVKQERNGDVARTYAGPGKAVGASALTPEDMRGIARQLRRRSCNRGAQTVEVLTQYGRRETPWNGSDLYPSQIANLP